MKDLNELTDEEVVKVFNDSFDNILSHGAPLPVDEIKEPKPEIQEMFFKALMALSFSPRAAFCSSIRAFAALRLISSCSVLFS